MAVLLFIKGLLGCRSLVVFPYRGGNATNGGNAGFEYVNVNNAASTTNVNNGSPLCFYP